MSKIKRFRTSFLLAVVIVIAFFIAPLYVPHKLNTAIANIFKDLYPAITAIGGLLLSIPLRLFWLSYIEPVLYIEKEIERRSFRPPIGTTLEYICNRIIVRNIGRSAARNCKAYIVIDYGKERVCWTVPLERPNATINSQDDERLDFCAFFAGNVTGMGLNTPPIIIAPTENGWDDTRDLSGLMECEVLITAENTTPVTRKVQIDLVNRKLILM